MKELHLGIAGNRSDSARARRRSRRPCGRPVTDKSLPISDL